MGAFAGLDLRTAVAVAYPLLAAGVGVWVYLDAGRRGYGDLSVVFGGVIAGLLLAGAVPGLVALAIADEAAAQGFPTALRVVPGVGAVVVYLYASRRGIGRTGEAGGTDAETGKSGR